MVGSRDSVGGPNVVLNTIVADALCDACDELEKAEDFDQAVHDLIKRYATEHQRIVFSGNGYSQEWVEEAKRRGLPNLPSMVDAIPALVSEESVRVFEKFGVFRRAELESRMEIKYEAYAKVINIEAKTMIDIARKQILPAVMNYTKTVAETVVAVRGAGAEPLVQMEVLTETNNLLKEVKDALVHLEEVTEEAGKRAEGCEQAHYYHDEVVPAMKALREPVDHLEMIVSKDMWPMPSYSDLLFEV